MIDLLRGLAEHGCTVSLLCASFPRELAARDFPFTIKNWNEIGGQWLSRRKEFEKVLMRQKPQLVHVHGNTLGLCGKSFLDSTNAPIVLTPHSSSESRRELRRIQKRADRVMAFSEYLREGLVNRVRVAKEKCVVVPPAIDVGLYDARPPRMSDRLPVVGTVAPLEPGRGQEIFVKAAKALLDSGRNAEFIVAGDGASERKMRSLAQSLGLDKHLVFVTRLSNYREYISALDIFVRPTVTGGIGYTILEAMAMAKPVVAAATEGVLEIVEDGRTGLLVEKGESAGIAEAVGKLLDDPKRAFDMGLEGRRIVAERFGMERLVERMRWLYTEAARQS